MVHLGGQLSVQLHKGFHEVALDSWPFQFEGWGEETVLYSEGLITQHDGLCPVCVCVCVCVCVDVFVDVHA